MQQLQCAIQFLINPRMKRSRKTGNHSDEENLQSRFRDEARNEPLRWQP